MREQLHGRLTGLVTTCILCMSALHAQPAPQEDGKRIALVIGNDNYKTRALQNAVNDARAMQKSLQGSGFQVTALENAGKAAMESGASSFLSRVGPGDTALLFYAGHAIQIDGENLLIPTDFESAANIIDAKYKSFSLTPVFDFLKRSRAKSVIVIIDACRVNPVAETYALKAGLADPSNAAGRNSYIAFSTSPGNVAGDNPNSSNSWFTEALADAIMQPNLTLDDVFTRVRLKVESATGGKQTPWSITNLTSKFYFHPPNTVAAETDETMLDKWLADLLRNEQYRNWPEAIELAERIVKQKPGGSVEETAKSRLPYLRLREDAEKKFEGGDFAAAVQLYNQGLKLEPFTIDAAFEAANGALLTGDLTKAVQALEAVRQRGPSAQVKRADDMLKELAAVEPAAAEALKRGLAKAPPLADLFPSQRFGFLDWEAARKWVRQSQAPVDFTAIVQQLPPPQPIPVAPVPSPNVQPQRTETASIASAQTEEARITLDDFYIDVHMVADSRDLVSDELGELTVQSKRKEIALALNGKAVSRQLPYTLKLPPGEYELRTIDRGKRVAERRVRVKANAATVLVLQ